MSEDVTPVKHGGEHPEWDYRVTYTPRPLSSFIENDDRFFTMIDKGWRLHSFHKDEESILYVALWEKPVDSRLRFEREMARL